MSFEYSSIQNENPSFMNQLIQDGGERQTTFMLYLSGTNKDIGGNTVFPQLGISVKPKRGTALYWNNIKSDGKFDTRSSHLGCPVILGNKWIANKWIRWHGQMDKIKCFVRN